MAAPTSHNGRDASLLLLQITNSSFPTGSFCHSYGMETLIAEGLIHSPASAEDWCRRWLRFGVATCDGVAVAGSFRRTLYEDMNGLVELNRLVESLKIGRESREASVKTGAALVAACRDIFKTPEISRLEASLKEHGMLPHHAVVYGVASAGLGFSQTQALETYLWSSFSNLISVVGRLLPLGQTDVQRILLEAMPLIERSAEIAGSRDESMMSSMNAALDAASMRHERLPSRLCIS